MVYFFSIGAHIFISFSVHSSRSKINIYYTELRYRKKQYLICSCSELTITIFHFQE